MNIALKIMLKNNFIIPLLADYASEIKLKLQVVRHEMKLRDNLKISEKYADNTRFSQRRVSKLL